ncbi:MAG: hypothetical protein LBK61_00125 [Spirochaetaceae bacterium]|jgi:hypothetical protein|nr:hypothetical protein [Spirochaetaceae bacterium]
MAALIAMVAARLHCIRVWACRNFLDKIKGMFFFRTETEAMVTTEEISAAVGNSGENSITRPWFHADNIRWNE